MQRGYYNIFNILNVVFCGYFRSFSCHMTDNFNVFERDAINYGTMASTSSSSTGPVRLGSVEGFGSRRNEVVYHSSEKQNPSGCVVYFGGDMQDYKENMLAHRDNKFYADWDLESTAALLHYRFPEQAIVIVKPSKMSLKSFSCYQHFVSVNNFGAPTYEKDIDSLKHLKLLLKNIGPVIEKYLKSLTDTHNSSQKITDFSEEPISIIGFSKGCVVLNQILYSFHSLLEVPDEEHRFFVKNINCMYWLEGGHSGVSDTWVTDKNVLRSFSNYKIDVHIHVTPYQVFCDTRPRIGKEEKIFRETLGRMNMCVTRKLHFESEPRSLENHFRVLKSF